MSISWESRYALRTKGITSSVIRELLKLTQRPEVIAFSGGLPAAEYFPVERFQEACQQVLASNARYALQYSTTEGYVPLRELIAQRLSRDGVNLSAENVLITSGSQQALSLIGALFINPGDLILVERPTYLGALQAFNAFQAQYIGVATDKDGIITGAMPEALRQGPKFMYILPNFQNPAGVTISRERRYELVRTADTFGVPIVEDDPYGELRFEGEHIKSLLAIDAELSASDGKSYAGDVIYFGTFSKTLAPGLRIAYAVAAPEVISRMVQFKQGFDLHTSIFDQMVIYEVAKDGFIDEHVASLRKVYQSRRDAMLGALDRYMPPEVDWTHPEGGLFLWMRLPEGMQAVQLFEESIKRDVAFVPGDAFYAEPNPPQCARLNFSTVNEDRIVEGIRRLSESVETLQQKHSTPVS